MGILINRQDTKGAVAAPLTDNTAPAVVAKLPLARLTPADREFLPAALEIIETPASPIRIAFLWFICIAAAAALTWSYFGKFDIQAVATGRVQPVGRSKVVQPFEAGRVVQVLVENGSTVKAGDPLVELDPTDASADSEAQLRDFESATAEAARRRLAVTVALSGQLAPRPVPFAPGTTGTVQIRENSVLTADIAKLAASQRSLQSQAEEQEAKRQRLTDSITARQRVIALHAERVDMRQQLKDRGAGSRALVLDAQQQLETEKATLVDEQGQLAETEATLATTKRKLVEQMAQFIAEQTEKLADAERKAERPEQELIKAQSKRERMQLRAPIAGTVQQLGVTTVGQVVTSAQPLMTIVPDDAAIEIEALVHNEDVGFVEPGQPAIIKVEAFPFTRYGIIEGTVTKISHEGIDQHEASNQNDPQSVAKNQTPAVNTTQRDEGLVFPATIALKQRAMSIDGKQIPFKPGMVVTVEIKTGQRRAIDYVLSPLREVTARVGRER
jgi:hemolysin D